MNILDVLHSVNGAINTGVGHMTDAVRQLLQRPIATTDHVHTEQGSASLNVEVDEIPLPATPPLVFIHDVNLLRVPASAYNSPYSGFSRFGINNSTQSLPPDYTPRDLNGPPPYISTGSLGAQTEGGTPSTGWRRVNDRISGARLYIPPFGLPRFHALAVFRSGSATSPPASARRSTPIPLYQPARRPRRLDWLTGRWKMAAGIAVVALVIGLIAVFMIQEQRMERQRKI